MHKLLPVIAILFTILTSVLAISAVQKRQLINSWAWTNIPRPYQVSDPQPAPPVVQPDPNQPANQPTYANLPEPPSGCGSQCHPVYSVDGSYTLQAWWNPDTQQYYTLDGHIETPPAACPSCVPIHGSLHGTNSSIISWVDQNTGINYAVGYNGALVPIGQAPAACPATECSPRQRADGSWEWVNWLQGPDGLNNPYSEARSIDTSGKASTNQYVQRQTSTQNAPALNTSSCSGPLCAVDSAKNSFVDKLKGLLY